MLQCNDYNKNYLDLLEQLTCVNKETIVYDKFCTFVNNLDANHVIYVIENDNKIVATGTIIIEQKLIHGLGLIGHIEDIVVDKQYNGKNLGRTIMNNLIEYAKIMNCYKVILDCNDYVTPFYEKCGFIKKGNCMAMYF